LLLGRGDLEGQSGLFSSFVLTCVLRATTKKEKKKVVNFFEEKSAPPEKILQCVWICPPMEKNHASSHARSAEM